MLQYPAFYRFRPSYGDLEQRIMKKKLRRELRLHKNSLNKLSLCQDMTAVNRCPRKMDFEKLTMKWTV